MKNKKGITRILTVVLALTLILTGCNTPKNVSPDNKNTDSKEKPIKLQVWLSPQWKGVYDSTEEGASYESFFKFVGQEYSKEHPNVQIDVQVIASDQRTEKLNVNLQAGTPPDIFYDSTFVLTDFAHRGALVPIDDIIDEQSKKDIPQGLWDYCTVAGKTYFYPFNNAPGTLVYNADIFKKAGLDKYIAGKDEIATWTIDEFKEVLETIKQKVPNVYPMGLFAANTQGDTWNLAYLRMFSSKFFDDNQNIVVNDENGVKALTFLKELYDKGLTNPGAESTSSNDVHALFQNQQVAISFVNSVLLNNVEKDMENNKVPKFDIRLANIPGANNPLSFTYVFGACVFDTKDNARVAAAKDFVKFFSSKQPYVKASKNGVPVRSSVINELKDKNPKFAAYDQNAKYMFNFSGGVPGYLELRQILYPELQAALTGTKTPKQALDDYAKKANETLARTKKDSVLLK